MLDTRKYIPKVEWELCRATQLKRVNHNVSLPKFYALLIRAVLALPKSVWNSLSPEAQQWVSDATKALNHQKALPPFPDHVRLNELRRKDIGKGKKSRLRNKALGQSTTRRILEILVDTGPFELPPSEIYAKIRGEGYIVSPVTVRQVVQLFRASYRLLDEKGLVKRTSGR